MHSRLLGYTHYTVLQAARGVAAFSAEEAARSVIVDMRGVHAIINQLPVECEEGQNIMTAVIEVKHKAQTLHSSRFSK